MWRYKTGKIKRFTRKKKIPAQMMHEVVYTVRKHKKKHQKYSYYHLLPYYRCRDQIYVLLGEKKSFNEVSGIIYENPGQKVICGSKLPNQKNTAQIIKNCILLFYRQTGHFIRNKDNITYILKNRNNYVLFYKISSFEEYSCLSKLKCVKNDINQSIYKDLCPISAKSSLLGLQWVTLTEAKKIFSSIVSNPPCSGNINLFVTKYINFIRNYGFVAPELEQFLFILQLKKNIKKKIYDHIYYQTFQNSPFLPLIKSYIKWSFFNKSDIKLFEDTCVILSKMLLKHTHYSMESIS